LPDWRERVERFLVRREEVVDERRVADGEADGHEMCHCKAYEEGDWLQEGVAVGESRSAKTVIAKLANSACQR